MSLIIWKYYNVESTALKSLEGLNSLSYVGGRVWIRSCSALESLMGLENLLHVGGDFYIADNDSILNTFGMGNISFIGGSFLIYDNPVLERIEGFEMLDYIGESLIIGASYESQEGNRSLTSLSGFDHSIYIGKSLWIKNNESLAKCEVSAVCRFLQITPDESYIANNASGCNSPEEVQDSCETHAGEADIGTTKDDIMLYPNPSSGPVRVKYTNYSIQNTIFKIYSIQGVVVMTLLSEVQQPGEYELAFDISDLPAGMYLLVMQTEDRKIVEKIMKY